MSCQLDFIAVYPRRACAARVTVYIIVLSSIIVAGCFNPRRACAARVTVLGLSVSHAVSVSVHDYSRTAGNEAVSQ